MWPASVYRQIVRGPFLFSFNNSFHSCSVLFCFLYVLWFYSFLNYVPSVLFTFITFSFVTNNELISIIFASCFFVCMYVCVCVCVCMFVCSVSIALREGTAEKKTTKRQTTGRPHFVTRSSSAPSLASQICVLPPHPPLVCGREGVAGEGEGNGVGGVPMVVGGSRPPRGSVTLLQQ